MTKKKSKKKTADYVYALEREGLVKKEKSGREALIQSTASLSPDAFS